jgi:hypothetical protein
MAMKKKHIAASCGLVIMAIVFIILLYIAAAISEGRL